MTSRRQDWTHAAEKDILELVSKLHKERKLTVIMVSHSMDDVAEYAEHIIVMNEGKVFAEGIPSEIFAKYKELEKDWPHGSTDGISRAWT